MPLAGGDARFQPVWVEDVAEAIVRCLDTPASIGQTIECAGPDVCTLAELVRLAGRWSGHERPILPLPMALGRLQALAGKLKRGCGNGGDLQPVLLADLVLFGILPGGVGYG